MSVLAITCDNCGAKYRLPETFQGDKAKCQKCSSVIDVAAQRKALAAPAAAPAPKPTAVPAAKKEPVRPAHESVKAGAAPARARRNRDQEAESPAEAKPSRTRGERKGKDEGAPKKSNTMLLAGGGIAALAIVAVIVVLSMNKKETPKATEQANVQATEKPAAKPAPEAPKAESQAQKPTQESTPEPQKPVAEANGNGKGEATPAVAPAKEQEPKTPPAETPKAEEPKKETPAESTPAKTEPASNDGTPKEKWEANKTANLADVFDAKTLGDVTWPAEIAAEEQTEVRSLVEDVVNGGRPGISAKPKLEKLGFAAIFGIAERLRQLDYKSSDDQMTAWELNKILESILITLNAGFVAVEAGSDLDPRKADHNARTNQAWARLLTRWASRDEFNTWRKEKLAEKSKK